MKIGIILQSNNPEHIWNTFRFGITSLKASHDVTIFLMSEGAELNTIVDTEYFDISKKVVDRIPQNKFRIVIAVFLLVIGIKLIFWP